MKLEPIGRRRPVRGWLTLFAVLAVAMTDARAEGWEFGGHLKVQFSSTDYSADNLVALYGADPARDQAFDGRLKAEWRGSGFDFSVHYELLALAGDSVTTRRTLNTMGLPVSGTATGLPNDAHQLMNLTDVLVDSNRNVAVQRLDRLAVGYGTGAWLVRFGRQAVSWGNGLAFQVLDFMNPFPPLAIDKDYKSGTDLLFGQWQLMGQGDVQAMIVPRRDLTTHAVTSSESSYAAKWRQRLAGLDVDLMAARHYDENLLGVGLARSLGGAVWRLDVLQSQISGSDNAWSFLTNLDYSWTLFGKNLYGFVEYFYSGVGEVRQENYLSPNPALAARLARGELYTLARDYLAVGGQLEFAPLVNGFATLLQNLDDSSRLLHLRLLYDWRQNTQLMAGAILPAGPRGSEYGGIAIPNPAPPPAWLGVQAPGQTYYVRLAYYF